MEQTTKQKTIKYALYFLMILLADLLQNVGNLLPEPAGARCFILIPLTIFLAAGEDFLIGTLMGLFAGLLWDLSAAVHIGFNCILLALFCFVCSALITYIARDIFVTNILISTISVIIYAIAYWLAFIVIKGVDGGFSTIFTFYIPSIIYTIIMSLLIWIIVKPIKKRLCKSNTTDI